MAEVTLKPLPPAEAIAFFEAKGLRAGFDWRDVWNHQHAEAFTVAKMMDLDLLSDVHRSFADTVLKGGGTVATWSQEVTPLLQARGWWGRKPLTDPKTGVTDTVQLGSPRRLRTIFDTNLRTAHAAGRWERIRRLAPARPWLRYVATLDDRTRPAHRVMHGVILPWDHPVWDRWYPPCGWFCRCTVEQLSDRDLDRRGLKPWAAPPDIPEVEHVNPRTGKAEMLPQGIDPGFGTNVGRGAEAVQRARLIERMEAAEPALARQLAAGMALDMSFDAFVQGRLPGEWPIAVLDDAAAVRMDSTARVVRLSQDGVLDHLKHRLGAEEHAAIQSLLDQPEEKWLPGNKPLHWATWGEIGGRLHLLVVKRTRKDDGLYVQSFRRTTRDKIDAAILRGYASAGMEEDVAGRAPPDPRRNRHLHARQGYGWEFHRVSATPLR